MIILYIFYKLLYLAHRGRRKAPSALLNPQNSAAAANSERWEGVQQVNDAVGGSALHPQGQNRSRRS